MFLLVLRNVQASALSTIFGNSPDDAEIMDLRFIQPSSIAPSSSSGTYCYYIIAPPEVTTDLLLPKDQADRASRYYQNHLNEESIEIWLHRAFQQNTTVAVADPKKADFFLIAGYLHLNSAVKSESKNRRRAPRQINHTSLIQLYQHRITDPSKPHLLLIPTWNGNRGNVVGIKALSASLVHQQVNLWSVGLERNEVWQGIGANRIIPIPYLVQQPMKSISLIQPRNNNSVFYAGDARPNAKIWSGCFREQMLLPLLRTTNATNKSLDIHLVGKDYRLNQSDYNRRMHQSDYCLILCGDTPSSRSLTSAMVSGCIPIRVGSRLRGLCEPPCKPGFGWKLSGPGNPHLPFPIHIPWDKFPEANEQEFFNSKGQEELQRIFSEYDHDAKTRKQDIRSIMESVWKGWIYGWGDPIGSTDFGEVHHYLLETFIRLAFA